MAAREQKEEEVSESVFSRRSVLSHVLCCVVILVVVCRCCEGNECQNNGIVATGESEGGSCGQLQVRCALLQLTVWIVCLWM